MTPADSSAPAPRPASPLANYRPSELAALEQLARVFLETEGVWAEHLCREVVGYHDLIRWAAERPVEETECFGYERELAFCHRRVVLAVAAHLAVRIGDPAEARSQWADGTGRR